MVSVSALFFLGMKSQNGQAPGLANGTLSRCSDKPNCVNSEHTDDADHYIEPVSMAGNGDIPPMENAVTTITEMQGVVQSNTDSYIAASFESSVFGFVDDFELRVDPIRGVIHVRSASRVGYSDGGVNRDRVRLFKDLYSKKKEAAQ